MKPLTPSVTILSLLQLFVIVGGYLMTRSFVRMWDRVWGEFSLDPGELTVPRLIAVHGLWFLVLPFVWCFIVVLSAKPADGPGSISRPVLMFGVLLTFALAIVFSFAVIAGMRAISSAM